MITTIQATRKAGLLDRVLAALVLFYGAMVFCLPVPHSEEVATLYPWWSRKIAIGNVLLHELLFLGWIVLYGRRFLARTLLNGGVPTQQAAVWLIALALWCGLISLLAPLPWLDVGRTLRLLLNAALLLAVVRWTRQMGNFPLVILVLGFLIGTIVNLIVSFQYPLVVYETMRLSGQNTPGVAMGVAIHLLAWLFLHTNHRSLRVFCLAATVVVAFGCAISYSRVGWFVGGLGLLAWAYVLLLARPRVLRERRWLKRFRLAMVPLLVVGVLVLVISPQGQESVEWVQTLAQQKVEGQEESNAARLAYFSGTAEIVARNPLGVGYSGFFDAMTDTESYRSGKATEEESRVDANPHASFLWYATTGGIPGIVLAVGTFILLLNSMRVGLVCALGRAGLTLFILAAPSFLMIGLTVPYLFNSIILIIPTAVAAAWGWAWRIEQAASFHYKPWAYKRSSTIL